ncbi:adenosylcobinamide-GDP ribazoletransferase [Rhodovulum viride]|uniref:Adenosylcobinamide-GDP ribazoletransferase n=1 Tax=Rhodovulum viride TaxID=1231134 RepID=A0ABX9DCX5_9RHOB|nr:adenosylcobinamide-GDP ribazoletransferase [Rhodovulum viride]RAP40185.1 adenosylcobinamide-GDP ribazoletransferase [Rhodovulum viride]
MTPAARLGEEARLVVLALQFVSRLPLPADPGYTPDRMRRATRYFPLCGALIGAALGLVYAAAAAVFPPAVAAVLTLAAGVRLTGALHEDGLADMADGLGGGLTRERALEIMRDSRIGSYGAVTLMLALGLKAAALAGLGAAAGGWAAAGALVAAHGLSRLASVIVMVRLPYARTEGKAAFAAAGPGRDGMAIAWGTGTLIALGLWIGAGFGAAATALALAAAVTLWMARMLTRRLGGHTGDGLGAVQQVSEIAILLGLLAWA